MARPAPSTRIACARREQLLAQGRFGYVSWGGRRRLGADSGAIAHVGVA